MALSIPLQTCHTRLFHIFAVWYSALFYCQLDLRSCRETKTCLPPLPLNNLSRTGGSSQWEMVLRYSALVPFSYLCATGSPWWFPMDPLWWMFLMKGVNLKSPAGYSCSIQEAASPPIQCSLRTDRGRPREKWGDGIGFEALRQVIKSNTPTHQGMWFPQVPLADMLNFFL